MTKSVGQSSYCETAYRSADKNSWSDMKYEPSLPYSLQSATGIYPAPDKFGTHRHIFL
jgi:hypothetical protein